MTKHFCKGMAVFAVFAVLALAAGCKQTVTVSEKKDKTPPAEVTALNAIAGDGKVSLSWTNPADEDLYQVEITASPAAGTLSNAVYLSAKKDENMSFTAEGLTNGTGYTFTVKTIDKSLNKSEGTSTAEAVKPVDTSDKTPPAEVTALNAVAGDGKISLSWKNPADEDLYQVEITASPAAGTLANAVYLSAKKSESMSFTAEGLTNGTAYRFTVKTIDKSLNKSAGAKTQNPVKPVSGTDSTPPAEVTALNAIAGDGKVSLSWTNPADEDLYQVEITASPAAGTLANAVYLAAEKGKAMSFTAEGLTNGTGYTFTVKTIDKALNKSAGAKTQNPVKPVDTSDKTPPAEVTNLQAAALAGAIRLTWIDPADTDLWGIEITSPLPIVTRSAAPIPENSILVPKGQQSLKISNLEVGKAYTFTVKTIDESGNKSAGKSTTAAIPLAGEPMTLTLTQNPTTLTNGNVTISFTSSTSVKTAKWAKGVKTVDEVLSSGTSITGNSFEVSENGKYPVGVQDNEGRREVKIIEITNIDKEPPPAPSNLTAVYRFGEKKIILNWIDPVDIGFGLKELRLTYTINGADEATETIAKGVQTFELTNVQAQNPPKTYAFSLKAIDNVGYESTAASVNITPSAPAEVTGISLNRTHLDTLMRDRNIKVTVSGNNFYELTSLLVQVTDGSTNYSSVSALIDPPNNKAWATIEAPDPSDEGTDEGTTYTVKAIVNSTTPAEATASFIVSNPARVANIVLTPNQLPFGSAEKVSIEVTGKNFDIRGETEIKLLDSNGSEVAGSMVTVRANVGNAASFTAKLPLPPESGVYTAAVYFDEKKESKTSTLHLYGAPEITSVSIPKAGTSYGGNKLPVRITGKNFTAPGISAASFSGIPALSDVQIVNDTLVRANVYCPYAAGETDLTVTCTPEGGSPVHGTRKIIVKDYSEYTVGKIVLADKTLKSKYGYTAIEPSNPPVAIICGVNGYGAALGIALHTSPSDLSLAEFRSTGYTIKFEDIICTPSNTGIGAASTAAFTGNLDGSDNWEYICGIDPKGTANAAKKYPAFHWVNQYNAAYADKLGGTNFAWYMPSLAELCEVYRNRKAINESLAKIHGLGNSYADSSLGTSWYWSSSQYASGNIYAWLVVFDDGNVHGYSKNSEHRVCCLVGF